MNSLIDSYSDGYQAGYRDGHRDAAAVYFKIRSGGDSEPKPNDLPQMAPGIGELNQSFRSYPLPKGVWPQ